MQLVVIIHLQPGSPAINNGVTLGAVTKDILNASRPLGHFYDMGAYEFAGPFNYYIDGVAGDDTTGSGTQLRPWKTIQKGADNTAPGDTVNVKGGITYTGSTSCGGLGNTVVCLTSSGSAGSYITYQSWVGTGIPIIDALGVSYGFAVASQNYINISGFEIKNASIGFISAGILLYNNHDVTIKNCIIHHNVLNGGFGIYRFSSATTNFKFYNNIIFDNIQGIQYDGSSSLTNEVKNNLIFNNSSAGIGGTGSSVTIDYNDVWGNAQNLMARIILGPVIFLPIHSLWMQPMVILPFLQLHRPSIMEQTWQR